MEFPLVALADGNAEVTGVVLAVRLDRLAIRGTVVDADGAPVPDARVVAELVENDAEPAFFQWRQGPSSTTDADGHFAIGELLAGTYALRASSPTGLAGTLGGVRAGRTDVVLPLPSAGTIEVTLAGFTSAPQVSALPAGNRHGSPIPAVGGGNTATFSNVAPGSYLVTARTAKEGASATVTVTGRNVTRITLASKGSNVIAGRVRELRTKKPVENMTCTAQPRAGITALPGQAGEGVRTDAQGAFVLDAPVGDIVVMCEGTWTQFSDGLRMVTLAQQRLDLDVTVVGWNSGGRVAGLGADFDHGVLIPRLAAVRPGGPIAKAGFANGDVITAVDGVSVTELSPSGTWALMIDRAPGSTMKLDAMRAGKPVTGQVVVESM